MKVTKKVKNKENKSKGITIDFKTSKSSVWNSKRRFEL